MAHKMNSTIKVYIYDYESARKNDYLIKRGCIPVGAGVGERSCYVLYASSDLLFTLLEDWKTK